MSRHREPFKKPWTPKQKAVVELAGQGVSITAAAREAGYSDPKGEKDRILSNPAIRDEILDRLAKKAISWRTMVAKAKKAVNEFCMTLADNDERDRNGRLVITVAERVSAAKVIMEQVRKADPDSLIEGARKEDEAESKAEAVDRILGQMNETEAALVDGGDKVH